MRDLRTIPFIQEKSLIFKLMNFYKELLICYVLAIPFFKRGRCKNTETQIILIDNITFNNYYCYPALLRSQTATTSLPSCKLYHGEDIFNAKSR